MESLKLPQELFVPYLLGQIGLVGNSGLLGLLLHLLPYLLGQIGLVGNFSKNLPILKLSSPYLLGQIGLVGNASVWRSCLRKSEPYLLGQIGLVGNALNIPDTAHLTSLTY